MEVPEASLRGGELLEGRLDMSSHLARLAVGALLAPGPDISLKVVPDEPV